MIHPDAGRKTWVVDADQSCPECAGPWQRLWAVDDAGDGRWETPGGVCRACRHVGVGRRHHHAAD